MDLPSTTLTWFFNDDEFALYRLAQDQYPLTVNPLNATYAALIGGVDIQILDARHLTEANDTATFISTLRVLNISTVETVELVVDIFQLLLV